jgi:hypothetical protein
MVSHLGPSGVWCCLGEYSLRLLGHPHYTREGGTRTCWDTHPLVRGIRRVLVWGLVFGADREAPAE